LDHVSLTDKVVAFTKERRSRFLSLRLSILATLYAHGTSQTPSSSQIDIEALTARYNDPDFWRRSMQESDDGPAE
jgi:hypothetical protein